MKENRVKMRVREYLVKKLYRGQDPIDVYINNSQGILPKGKSVVIPSSPFRFFRSNEYQMGTLGYGAANRKIGEYRSMAFGDEQFEPPVIWDTHPTVSSVTEKFSGGEQATFAPGQVVVDLGSGRAIALHEYARLYPEATIIGIDNCYTKQKKLNLKKSGLQLTKDDWKTLSSLPDNSVDTFLSVIGIIPYGIDMNNADSSEILDTIGRKIKRGGIFRFHSTIDYTMDTNGDRSLRSNEHKISLQKRNYIINLLLEKGWEVYPVYDENGIMKQTIVARKID